MGIREEVKQLISFKEEFSWPEKTFRDQLESLFEANASRVAELKLLHEGYVYACKRIPTKTLRRELLLSSPFEQELKERERLFAVERGDLPLSEFIKG